MDNKTKADKEWFDMPEYNMTRIKPVRIIKINFLNQKDIDDFGKLFGEEIKPNKENYWYPKMHVVTTSDMVYVDEP